MTTNADLIAEARRLKAESERAPFTNFQFEQVGRRMIVGGFLIDMADALEAAEAQVAELSICPDDDPSWRHYRACHNPKDWPADLLEAGADPQRRPASENDA